MAKFDYSIHHIPGKLLYTADALSRAPISVADEESLQSQEEVEAFIQTVTSTLPATEHRLEMYRKAQAEDAVCSTVREYCERGWPERRLVKPDIRPYWKFKSSLTLHGDLLLFNHRIVIPASLQRETLKRIHEGHQGIERCRMRVKSSVWWPGVTDQIVQLVEQCSVCAKAASLRKEPLVPSPLPQYPWQVIASDLFELEGNHYLVVVDYFSRYPEVIRMTSTTSAAVITALKSIFSRHGIPEIVRSDNGPQYASREFTAFAASYGFQLVTSSPRYPQSNGQAERTVKTVKTMLKKADDRHLALLSYRATPFPWCGLSPAQLLMGRHIRTSLPQSDKHLIPEWPYLQEFRERNQSFKEKQKQDFDRRHRARELPAIPDETEVWIKSEGNPVQGQVVSSADTPRSYVVDTPTGQVRRNRHHLAVVPDRSPEDESPPIVAPEPPGRIMTRSQTGTPIYSPERLT